MSSSESDREAGGPPVVTDVEPSDLAEDLTAAPGESASLVPPEIMAQTLGEYGRGLVLRLRSGESGMLPVILGLIIITVIFQVISPHHVFLTAGNIVNLFQQSAVFMVLAMAEIFVLLLGEIDLSIGYGAAVGATIAVQLVQPTTANWPWWAAIIVAVIAMGVWGAIQGTIITRLGIPSFIVTLAGLLVLEGLQLRLLQIGPFSGILSLNGSQRDVKTLYNLMWGRVTPIEGWVSMAIIVGLLGLSMFVRDSRRRRSGLVAPPLSLTVIKVIFLAAVGIAIVAICNVNRARFGTLRGVPWVVYIVLGLLGVYTFLLQRTRYGRYIYAIGGNPEAARRAGVKVASIRTWAFVLCSATAAIAGLLNASYLGGVSNNVNGGQLVLYAVAAAVIGGTSLFGGRGRASHGVLGGLVIGAIYNGMYLQNVQVAWQFMVTGFVLLFAATIDAISRRGGAGVGSVLR